MIRVHNISCQHLDIPEYFIGSDHRVYPCCYHYDAAITKDPDIIRLYDRYGKDFNNLRVHTLNDIINHEWYAGVLEQSLNKEHPLNCARCWKSCGDKGKRKTIKVVNQ